MYVTNDTDKFLQILLFPISAIKIWNSLPQHMILNRDRTIQAQPS